MGNRWHGLRFPFKKTSKGLFEDPDDGELIESSIKFILNTGLGEYITLPEFGSKLPEDLFEPNDAFLAALVERHVFDALTRWEPRITVTKVETTTDEHELRLLVTYFIKSNPDKLRFFSDTFERQV